MRVTFRAKRTPVRQQKSQSKNQEHEDVGHNGIRRPFRTGAVCGSASYLRPDRRFLQSNVDDFGILGIIDVGYDDVHRLRVSELLGTYCDQRRAGAGLRAHADQLAVAPY